jgi:uncharacterized membrane protein YccC
LVLFFKKELHLLKLLPISLNVGAVSLAEGLRAGIAVAVIVLAGAFWHLPHFGLAALGALLTCFADPGGPVRRRVPAVLAFALLSGLAYGVFGLLRGQGAWVAAPLAGAAIFAAGYARIYGQGGLQVGNLLSVVIVLALDVPAGGVEKAFAQGCNLSAGALWAAILTLAIWRLHPYRPSRVALADVARRLGALAKDLAALANAQESVAAFEAHAATHRRAVREAIETARGVALDTFRRRGAVSARAAHTALRLQTLEQVFAVLIALSDVLENDARRRQEAARPIRLVAAWLAALAPGLETGETLDSEKKRRSLENLRAQLAPLPADSAARHLLEAIAEHFALLTLGTVPAGERLPNTPQSWRVRLLSPIRANWNFASAPMRHALRAGVTATPVLFVTSLFHQPFAHWATITMILCLQPYFSATWMRSAERVAGTVLGGLVAAGIGLLAQSKAELAIIMLPLTMFAFAIRGVSYGAFVAALTPMVVLLIEQIAPGSSELAVAGLRVLYTLLGGLLAIAANLLLWPGFEHSRLETTIRAAINAHIAYANAVFTTLLDGAGAPDAARRAAGMASNNLEAALSRALLEPHRGANAAIERGAVVDAALRRIAGRLSVLALDRPRIGPDARPLWRDWQAWLAQSLAAKPGKRPQLPSGQGGDTLARLARQVELIAE